MFPHFPLYLSALTSHLPVSSISSKSYFTASACHRICVWVHPSFHGPNRLIHQEWNFWSSFCLEGLEGWRHQSHKLSSATETQLLSNPKLHPASQSAALQPTASTTQHHNQHLARPQVCCPCWCLACSYILPTSCPFLSMVLSQLSQPMPSLFLILFLCWCASWCLVCSRARW